MNSAPLQYLIDLLNEAEELSHNPELQHILSEIKNSNLNLNSILVENYRLSSFSLFQKRDEKSNEASEIEFQNLIKADLWLKKEFNLMTSYSKEKLIELNKIVVGNDSTGIRNFNFDSEYDFLPYQLMNDAFELSKKIIKSEILNNFVQAVLLFQLFLSIHPFHNGNHRTFRLLLDHHLMRINLLPTTVRSNSDLILANSYSNTFYKLEAAIQKVLYCIGETITENVLSSV